MKFRAIEAQIRVDRDQEVLDAIRRFGSPCGAAVVCRMLNFNKSCSWCPIKKIVGQLAPQVPESSRDRVNRILKRLRRNGVLADTLIWRRPMYWFAEEVKKWGSTCQ